MFSLLLFGGASLRNAEQPLRGPVAQRRRLALLALLAVSGGRAVTRDRLIAYLWPESDTDRARHLLSESLYVMRKALGEEAVLAAGDELQLNPEVVTTDVGSFEEALEQEEFERAVSLYRGPFLDGFFLGDAPEFERWVEGERTRLARGYERALDALANARAAAGDLPAAAEAWRQLAVADPFNSRVALQLMRALATSGDRAGALQHARVHTVLLREEFDAEPDPEITAYAERLRTEPETAEPAVSLPAAPAAAAEEAGSASWPAGEPTDAAAAAAAGSLATSTLSRVEAGEIRVRRETHGVARAPVARRSPGRPWLLPAAGVLLLTAGVAILRFERVRELVPATLLPASLAVDERSIAVLPFADLTPQRDHEWFSDGMTEELIDALARIEGLRVPARTSSFAFKGRSADVREIGERLGVRHVLDGSVRKAGNRLRISARLIHVRSGYHLWSDTWELEMEDVFTVQDEIARAIVGSLHPRLTGAAAPPLVRPGTSNREAYNLYQQGRFFWNKRTPDGLARAMTLFGEALAHDPTFARAHAGLADSYALLVTFGALSPAEGYPRARAAAEQALALDPTLAEAHASLALVQLYYDRDWVGADRQFRRAIELSPGYATARHWYANFLAYRGNHNAARAQMQRALEVDPLSVAIQTAAGTLYYYAREYDHAVAQYRTALEMEPTFWPALMQLGSAHLHQGLHREAITQVEEATRLSGDHPLPLAFLGYSYAAAGRREEARQILERLQEEAKTRYISPVYLAGIHAALQENDAAFEWLELGLEARDDWMIYLRADPVFDPLRSDPRFPRMLALVGAGS